MGLDFYVIYDRNNASIFTENLVQSLENRGYRGFFPGRDELPGGSLLEQLSQNIQDARVTIVVVTPGFLLDSYARFSCDIAVEESVRRGKLIIPIGIGISDNEKPVAMKALKWIHFMMDWKHPCNAQNWTRISEIFDRDVPHSSQPAEQEQEYIYQRERSDEKLQTDNGAFVAQPFQDKVPDEIAYDPYKLYLYNKAIRKGKETEKVLRINIIGNYGQGKTSLARSLIGQTSEGVTSTNGIDISRYTCKRSEDGIISANQCENDSQDIMNRLATVASSIPVNLSSSENTVQNIDKMSAENGSQVNDTENRNDFGMEPLKANTKQTTDGRQGDSTVQHEGKPKNKMPFSSEEYEEFSAAVEKQKDASEHLLDIWDFGGQYIFYATHTLFHSKNALYLLVFDLTSPLDKIVRDENFPNETGEKDMAFFAKFWVESIDAYTGQGTQVILIGTHKDKLDNPDKWKDDFFENVRRLFDSLEGTDENQLSSHIQPEDFAVDNSNSPDSGIRELLAFILKKHQELVQTVEIPARWIQLEKALNDERGKKVVTFQDVMNMDKTIKYSLKDADQVKLFLSYHHDKGRLFYFDDGQPSDPIILDPKFLIDAFKCIITSEQFIRKSDARAEWIILIHEGILTEKLIDRVWSQQEDFKQHKDVLLKFLSKHNILSQVMGSQGSTGTVKGETLYVVPCMLRDFEKTTDTLKRFLDKKRQTQIRYLLKFTRPSVAQMVFHRVIAAMFGTWPVVNCCKTKLFFENMCVFEVLETTECKSTNYAVVIECVQECGSIELRLVNLSRGEIRSEVADQVRRYVESFVKVEFRRLTYSYIDNVEPYSRAYRCNHDDHPAGSGSSTIKELNENEDIRCPDNDTHDNDFFTNAKEEWIIQDRDEKRYPKLQLTEQHLSLLAQAIGENWQLLGPALGVKQTVMDHINDDHRTACMKIYYMLLKWKNSDIAEKATLDALVDVVKRCPKVRVEWDEFRNIRDEFCRKSSKAGFIQPLSDKVFRLNENLTLACKTTRQDSVTWQKNGKVISPDDHIKISADGDQQVLTVGKVDHDDAGTYRCVCGGTATECVVKVQDPTAPLEFIEGLSDTDVAYTRSEKEIIGIASFTCVLNRNSTDVTWFKRETCIEQSDKYVIVADGTIHKLKIKNVTEEDEDVYCVKAEGKKSKALLYVEETEEERRLLQEHLQKKQETVERRRLLLEHLEKTQETEEVRRLLQEHLQKTRVEERMRVLLEVTQEAARRRRLLREFPQETQETEEVRRWLRALPQETQSEEERRLLQEELQETETEEERRLLQEELQETETEKEWRLLRKFRQKTQAEDVMRLLRALPQETQVEKERRWLREFRQEIQGRQEDSARQQARAESQEIRQREIERQQKEEEERQ